MMIALRDPAIHPIVFLIAHDGRPPTRVDTGLVASWFYGDLIVMVAPDDLDGVIATLRAAVGTARQEDSK